MKPGQPKKPGLPGFFSFGSRLAVRRSTPEIIARRLNCNDFYSAHLPGRSAAASGRRRSGQAALGVLALTLFAGLLPLSAGASDEMPTKGEVCTDDQGLHFRGLTFRLENDLFADTDQDYTNGVSLTAVSQDLPTGFNPDCLPWPVRLHADLIARADPGFWHDGERVTRARNVALKFGQSMYTPADRSRTDLIVDDRPYAGLLYLGLAWNHRRLNPHTNVETLDTREATIGIIGPMSLAHASQDWVHDRIGAGKFQGWHNQLGNEPALQLMRERKYRDYRGPGPVIPGFAADRIGAFGLHLGNIETSASASLEGRIGWNLPNDFGTYPIRPGDENRPPSPEAGAALATARPRPGVHLFAVLEAKLVLHDFALDGNLFRDSHSVDRRPLVGQAAVGLSVQGPLAGHGVKLAVMRVFRTREFSEQDSKHGFGSIALSVDF